MVSAVNEINVRKARQTWDGGSGERFLGKITYELRHKCQEWSRGVKNWGGSRGALSRQSKLQRKGPWRWKWLRRNRRKTGRGWDIVRVIQDEIVQVGRGSTKQKLQETMRNLDFILGAMESRWSLLESYWRNEMIWSQLKTKYHSLCWGKNRLSRDCQWDRKKIRNFIT